MPDTPANPTRPRVLVVEDNPHARNIISRFLSKRYDVDAVGDSDGALEQAQQQAYDAFVLDIHLGEDSTGVDVLHALRQLPDYASTPAIAVTAYVSDEKESMLREAGFNGYLPKPFFEEDLHRALVGVLG